MAKRPLANRTAGKVRSSRKPAPPIAAAAAPMTATQGERLLVLFTRIAGQLDVLIAQRRTGKTSNKAA